MKRKGRDLTQSYDKSPYTYELSGYQKITRHKQNMANLCVNPPRTQRTFTHNLMAGGYFPCTVIPSDYVGIIRILITGRTMEGAST